MISGVSRTYEELEVGAVHRSGFGRTVPMPTLLTLNTKPIHCDVQSFARSRDVA